MRFHAFVGLLSCLTALAVAQDASLKVDVASARSAADVYSRTDAAVKQLTENLGALTKRAREARIRAGRYDARVPFSLPTRVVLTSGGRAFSSPHIRPLGSVSGLNLVFDSSGPYVFDPTYRDFLIGVYNTARPFIEAVFGQAAVPGDVHVRNYDATMGDRNIVSGGYYVPNGPDGPEIRFPVYSSGQLSETVAVNFLHTLILAYQGTTPYGFDAFQEGLTRAATMKVARQPGAMPVSLDAGLISAVLESTYDVGPFYDWYNQRALGGAKFIAPNLRDVQLPVGGSLGGLYLMRYQMSGSAWQKLLAEYPSFIAAFNAGFYANPALASDVPGLVALGQATLNTLKPLDPTVEGMSFSEWFRRQYILETHDTRGQKLLVAPIPIASGLGGNDFGVFIVEANWFETTAGGNEILLSGTSFPIFWEGETSLNRIFPSTQEDRMDIAGAYGAVEPNLPDLNSGQPYRATVDIPVADQLGRVYLPAGAIATAANPNERDFYGTVTGVSEVQGDSMRLQVNVNGTQLADVPVVNDAFGITIGTPAYLGYAKVTVSVIYTHNGGDVPVLTRVIDKGPGPLALDLRVSGEGTYTFPFSLPRGIAMIGFPVDPFASIQSDVLGIPENQVLVARYNSSKAKYELFPDTEPFKIGHGYFVRSEVSKSPFTVDGRLQRNVEMSVALKPGWNMISTPLTEDVPTSRIRLVKAAEFPRTFTESLGVDLGTDFFGFSPGTPDPASGAPEGGTLSPSTVFEHGKAYFVRVLAPEGVTLVFAPAPSLTPQAIAQPPRTAALTTTGWQMSLTLQLDRQVAKAFIGESRTATRAFDAREDSGMPPGIGGLQVVVENTEPMYRDIRTLGSAESYHVRLDGLERGKSYRLRFAMVTGRLDRFTVYNAAGRPIGTYRPGDSLSILGRGTSEFFEIRVSGGTR